jgi:hypothetical protein
VLHQNREANAYPPPAPRRRRRAAAADPDETLGGDARVMSRAIPANEERPLEERPSRFSVS